MAASGFSPGHRDLLRIFANPNESQPAGITHSFFGQALRRNGTISLWYDREIHPGTEFEGEIAQHLATCDIFLALLSSDFLDSYWCVERELQLALDRHAAESVVAIPIILRPCDWKESEIASLQALPRDGLPITMWPNEDLAFEDIIRGLRKAIKRFGGVSTENIATQSLQGSKSLTGSNRTSGELTTPLRNLRDDVGMFGHNSPASQAILKRLSELEVLGVEVSSSTDFAHFDHVHTITNGERPSPFFNPRIQPLDPANSFWMSIQHTGSEDIIGLQAFRMVSAKPNLREFVGKWITESYGRAGEVLELQEHPSIHSIAHQIVGKVVYHGELWVDRAVRDRRIVYIFANLGLLLAFNKFKPKAIFALTSRTMATHGHLNRIGFSTLEDGFLRWKSESQNVDAEEWIALCFEHDFQRMIQPKSKPLSV